MPKPGQRKRAKGGRMMEWRLCGKSPNRKYRWVFAKKASPKRASRPSKARAKPRSRPSPSKSKNSGSGHTSNKPKRWSVAKMCLVGGGVVAATGIGGMYADRIVEAAAGGIEDLKAGALTPRAVGVAGGIVIPAAAAAAPGVGRKYNNWLATYNLRK